MKKLDLSIVIVDYNAKDFLKECLISIRSAKIVLQYEVIVVDNASPISSTAMVRKEFPEVMLVESKDNLGFSKGNNLGLKKAHGRYVLFLNPDTIVYPKTIDGMVQFMDNHLDCGAATCKLNQPDGTIDYASHRGFPTPWNSFTYFSGLGKILSKTKLFGGYTMGYKDFAKTHEIDVLAGAFMLVRRTAGDQVGWWDEDYFFNGEDIDFCYCLRQKGWKIYYVPEYEILHYNGVSGGTKKHSQNITTANKELKRKIQRIRFDAMRIFYKKHYQKKYPHIVNWLVFQGINFREWSALRKF